MRGALATLFLVIVLTLYAVGLGGVLFVSQATGLFSLAAFVLTVLVWVIKHGFQRQPVILKRLFTVTMACFFVLMATTILLSINRGAPKSDGLAVFAPREQYAFTRSDDVSRLRFVTVDASFLLAWHGFGMVFAIELWAHLRGLPLSAPQRGRRAIQT